MTKDIKNALIIDDMCLTFTNNITFQNQVQSDILTLPFYVMAIPEFLCGVSVFFFQFTSIEFILAQGSRTMQGLLIGIWFIQISISCLTLTLSSSWLGCQWEYYVAKSSVHFSHCLYYCFI